MRYYSPVSDCFEERLTHAEWKEWLLISVTVLGQMAYVPSESWHPERAVDPGSVLDSFVNENQPLQVHWLERNIQENCPLSPHNVSSQKNRSMYIPIWWSFNSGSLYILPWGKGLMQRPRIRLGPQTLFKMDIPLSFSMLPCQGHGINGALSDENSQYW